MKIILCNKYGSIAGFLLRWWMGSRWSHSVVWDETQRAVYHATFLDGVHATAEAEFFLDYPQPRKVIDPEIKDTAGARAWCIAQLGKRYDWGAVLAIYLRVKLRRWQMADKWFCSEFTETLRSLFGRRRFREKAYAITPYHQDIIL